MGTTVATGTVIVYATSSIFAALSNFKFSFYLAAFSNCIIAIVWLILYKKAVSLSKAEKANETEEKKEIYAENTQKLAGNEIKKFYISIGVLCFLAVGINLIKDGLTTWVPSMLKEEYAFSDSLSILLTLLLPIVAIVGSAFALKITSVFLCLCVEK